MRPVDIRLGWVRALRATAATPSRLTAATNSRACGGMVAAARFAGSALTAG
jgi:hypothetical protein